MTYKFILVGQTAVPCNDLMEWARWMETADRVVFKTDVGVWEVSTQFLGLDHNLHRQITGEGDPLLYETMIFYRPAGENDYLGRSMNMSSAELVEWQRAVESTLSDRDLALIYHQERWSEWSEAEEGHELTVRMVEQHTGLVRTPQVDSQSEFLHDSNR